jgi:hypothetical protein
MNAERIFNIVLMEFNSEKLKREEDLERMINSDEKIDFKLVNIKQLVNDITKLEANIAKFSQMIKNDTTNNGMINNETTN